jgi:hypothetical protein
MSVHFRRGGAAETCSVLLLAPACWNSSSYGGGRAIAGAGDYERPAVRERPGAAIGLRLAASPDSGALIASLIVGMMFS